MMTFQFRKQQGGVVFSSNFWTIYKNVNEPRLFIYAESQIRSQQFGVKSIGNYVTSANSSARPNDKFLEHFTQKIQVMDQLALYLGQKSERFHFNHTLLATRYLDIKHHKSLFYKYWIHKWQVYVNVPYSNA